MYNLIYSNNQGSFWQVLGCLQSSFPSPKSISQLYSIHITIPKATRQAACRRKMSFKASYTTLEAAKYYSNQLSSYSAWYNMSLDRSNRARTSIQDSCSQIKKMHSAQSDQEPVAKEGITNESIFSQSKRYWVGLTFFNSVRSWFWPFRYQNTGC